MYRFHRDIVVMIILIAATYVTARSISVCRALHIATRPSSSPLLGVPRTPPTPCFISNWALSTTPLPHPLDLRRISFVLKDTRFVGGSAVVASGSSSPRALILALLSTSASVSSEPLGIQPFFVFTLRWMCNVRRRPLVLRIWSIAIVH